MLYNPIDKNPDCSNQGIYSIRDPLFVLNFLPTNTPKQIIISEKVRRILPELSETHVESFYWVIGINNPDNFLALEFRFVANGTPTSVKLDNSLWFDFNQHLDSSSKRIPNLSVLPLHNHPNLIESAKTRDGFFSLIGPYRQQSLAYFNQLLHFLGDRETSALEFLENINSNRQVKIQRALEKRAMDFVEASTSTLSQADCELKSSLHLLFCPSKKEANIENSLFAIPVERDDKVDSDLTIHYPSLTRIPIAFEARIPTSTKREIRRVQKILDQEYDRIVKDWEKWHGQLKPELSLFPNPELLRAEFLRRAKVSES